MLAGLIMSCGSGWGTPKITLHTTIPEGAKIRLYIASNDDVVIENATGGFKNGDYADYTVVKSPIVIQGSLQVLDCKESEITLLELEEERSLEVLNCSGNKLKELNVSDCNGLKSCSVLQTTSILLRSQTTRNSFFWIALGINLQSSTCPKVRTLAY